MLWVIDGPSMCLFSSWLLVLGNKTGLRFWYDWSYFLLHTTEGNGDSVTKYRSLSGFCNRNVLWVGSGGCSARERSWQDTALLCILTSSLGLWMAILSVFLHGSFSMCPCSPCLSVLLPPLFNSMLVKLFYSPPCRPHLKALSKAVTL